MDKTNEAEIDWKEYDREETAFRRKELSNAVDASGLGCSLYELPSGMRSWPYHYHTANEEAIYVLAGDGQLETETGLESLTAGDYVTLPADESGGHRVVNDSEGALRYLAMSTMNEPDVTVYPEMGKFGVYVGSPPGGRDDRSLEGYYYIDDETAYWEE
ncbi:cupin domain-containing protein [Natrinema longum]|uniref:Cupin domain-containing protein n=1 Tax=Natrinema longum TaxID=370324 RepID=A0A8A2UA61_9EURY|nr:cupin domain-containing protein [Natrinema longum]MBZ6493580.1 cupin domain-containing protein [Natrinema longum]QSW85075.1 cupin domain-containing protein [Natrinema longum]